MPVSEAAEVGFPVARVSVPAGAVTITHSDGHPALRVARYVAPISIKPAASRAGKMPVATESEAPTDETRATGSHSILERFIARLREEAAWRLAGRREPPHPKAIVGSHDTPGSWEERC
jgi:hypothetical protein